MARKLDTAVIAISSVSRAYYGRNSKRSSEDGEDPIEWLAAAKESGDIEYACAVFIYLDTSAEVDMAGESAARLIVAKSRRGTRGFVGMRFHGPSGAFRPASDALTALGSAAKNDRDDAKVLKYVRRPSYVPVAKRQLRGAVKGMSSAAVDAAVVRLVADGRIELRTMKQPNARGQLRDTQVVVAVGEEENAEAGAQPE